MENHFLIKVLRWAVDKSDGFGYDELFSSISLSDGEKAMLTRYFENARLNAKNRNMDKAQIEDTVFLVVEGDAWHNGFSSPDLKYAIAFEALFKYIDFLELKEARENAKQAHRIALGAILLSTVSIFVSMYAPIWTSTHMQQTVEVTEQQFQTILDSLNNLNKE